MEGGKWERGRSPPRERTSRNQSRGDEHKDRRPSKREEGREGEPTNAITSNGSRTSSSRQGHQYPLTSLQKKRQAALALSFSPPPSSSSSSAAVSSSKLLPTASSSSSSSLSRVFFKNRSSNNSTSSTRAGGRGGPTSSGSGTRGEGASSWDLRAQRRERQVWSECMKGLQVLSQQLHLLQGQTEEGEAAVIEAPLHQSFSSLHLSSPLPPPSPIPSSILSTSSSTFSILPPPPTAITATTPLSVSLSYSVAEALEKILDELSTLSLPVASISNEEVANLFTALCNTTSLAIKVFLPKEDGERDVSTSSSASSSLDLLSLQQIYPLLSLGSHRIASYFSYTYTRLSSSSIPFTYAQLGVVISLFSSSLDLLLQLQQQQQQGEGKGGVGGGEGKGAIGERGGEDGGASIIVALMRALSQVVHDHGEKLCSTTSSTSTETTTTLLYTSFLPLVIQLAEQIRPSQASASSYNIQHAAIDTIANLVMHKQPSLRQHHPTLIALLLRCLSSFSAATSIYSEEEDDLGSTVGAISTTTTTNTPTTASSPLTPLACRRLLLSTLRALHMLALYPHEGNRSPFDSRAGSRSSFDSRAVGMIVLAANRLLQPRTWIPIFEGNTICSTATICSRSTTTANDTITSNSTTTGGGSTTTSFTIFASSTSSCRSATTTMNGSSRSIKEGKEGGGGGRKEGLQHMRPVWDEIDEANSTMTPSSTSSRGRGGLSSPHHPWATASSPTRYHHSPSPGNQPRSANSSRGGATTRSSSTSLAPASCPLTTRLRLQSLGLVGSLALHYPRAMLGHWALLIPDHPETTAAITKGGRKKRLGPGPAPLLLIIEYYDDAVEGSGGRLRTQGAITLAAMLSTAPLKQWCDALANAPPHSGTRLLTDRLLGTLMAIHEVLPRAIRRLPPGPPPFLQELAKAIGTLVTYVPYPSTTSTTASTTTSSLSRGRRASLSRSNSTAINTWEVAIQQMNDYLYQALQSLQQLYVWGGTDAGMKHDLSHALAAALANAPQPLLLCRNLLLSSPDGTLPLVDRLLEAAADTTTSSSSTPSPAPASPTTSGGGLRQEALLLLGRAARDFGDIVCTGPRGAALRGVLTKAFGEMDQNTRLHALKVVEELLQWRATLGETTASKKSNSKQLQQQQGGAEGGTIVSSTTASSHLSGQWIFFLMKHVRRAWLDPYHGVRAVACACLGHFTKEDWLALELEDRRQCLAQVTASAQGDPASGVKSAACRVLGVVVPWLDEVVPPLPPSTIPATTTATTPPTTTSTTACFSMGQQACQALMIAARDDRVGVRSQAVWALSNASQALAKGLLIDPPVASSSQLLPSDTSSSSARCFSPSFSSPLSGQLMQTARNSNSTTTITTTGNTGPPSSPAKQVMQMDRARNSTITSTTGNTGPPSSPTKQSMQMDRASDRSSTPSSSSSSSPTKQVMQRHQPSKSSITSSTFMPLSTSSLAYQLCSTALQIALTQDKMASSALRAMGFLAGGLAHTKLQDECIICLVEAVKSSGDSSTQVKARWNACCALSSVLITLRSSCAPLEKGRPWTAPLFTTLAHALMTDSNPKVRGHAATALRAVNRREGYDGGNNNRTNNTTAGKAAIEGGGSSSPSSLSTFIKVFEAAVEAESTFIKVFGAEAAMEAVSANPSPSIDRLLQHLLTLALFPPPSAAAKEEVDVSSKEKIEEKEGEEDQQGKERETIDLVQRMMLMMPEGKGGDGGVRIRRVMEWLRAKGPGEGRGEIAIKLAEYGSQLGWSYDLIEELQSLGGRGSRQQSSTARRFSTSFSVSSTEVDSEEVGGEEEEEEEEEI